MKTLTTTCALALMLFATSGCQQPGNSTANSQSMFNWGRPNNAFANNTNSGGWFANRGGTQQIQTRTPQEYQYYSGLANQLNQLNQRVTAFDSDNQMLHTEVAGLKQKLQLANDVNQQLKQQLADTAGQFQQLQSQKYSIEQQLVAARNQINQLNQFSRTAQQAPVNNNTFPNSGVSGRPANANGAPPPTQFAGRATLRSNNSLLNRLNEIQIPGGQARIDGDVIRIEFPSDRLFTQGTYQIQPAQTPLMQNIVGTIQQSFPRQIIGIEAHWDGTPLQPAGTTDHQLTATQALAVFNNLARLGLAQRQMFTMGMGSNRPRHQQSSLGGISPNRRIEIVIYPETFDGT